MARYRDRLLANAGPVEQRVIGGLPWRPWDSWQWRFDTGGPVHPSRQYIGPDHALGLPALYAGVKLIADNIASMPLRVYLNQNGNSGYPGKKLWTGPSFFDEPSYYNTMFEWVNMMMVSVLLQGNAWGWITGKDAYGKPTGIEWIPPQDVYVHESENEQTWNPMRAKVFVFGREARWHGPDTELFHLRGMPLPGRIEGISPLRAFALLITSGTEAARYGTDWYASGGFPPGTFQNAEVEVDKQQAAEMRAELVKSLRRREPLVYGRDWDYKPVTVPPSEAQFLEAIQMNACTTPDARISMADGTRKRAGDLLIGDEVQAWDGKQLVQDRVIGLREMPVAPLYRVKAAGGRELVTTGNHPYLAARRIRMPSGWYSHPDLDSAASWLRADELQAGDYVRVGLDWNASGTVVDTETAWALGVLAGNGGLTGVTATFSTPDVNVAERLSAWADREGGRLALLDVQDGANCQRFNLTGVRELLRAYGVLGKYAYEKSVPLSIMRADRKAQAAFLSGYLDADGTVTKLSEVPCASWSSSSRELLDDCQHLLAMCGINAALHPSGKPGSTVIKGRATKRRQQWRLSVQGVATVRALAAILDVTHAEKRKRLFSWGQEVPVKGVKSDYRWAKIVAVESAGTGPTIGVEIARTHTHVTEGIVTHNTQVAAILNLPPDRIGGTRGDSLTYSTVEQSTLQIIEACRPWLMNFEDRASKLILPRQRMCKFYTDALLKTDLEARINMYLIMRNMGMRTINEIRELEDLPPLPGDVGNEALPLTTMNAMGTRAGVIPKSFMKAVVLEMDVATDRLIKLEKYIIPALAKQGYPVQAPQVTPGQGGSGSSSGSSGSSGKGLGNPAKGAGAAAGAAGTADQGGPITVNGRTGYPIGKPNAPLPLAQDPASFLASLISFQRDASLPYEDRMMCQEMLQAIVTREERIRQSDPRVNDDGEEDSAGVPAGLATFVPNRASVRDMVYATNGKGRGHLLWNGPVWFTQAKSSRGSSTTVFRQTARCSCNRNCASFSRAAGCALSGCRETCSCTRRLTPVITLSRLSNCCASFRPTLI